MHAKRSCPCPQAAFPDCEDQIIQSAVLLNVVALHPVQVTEEELIREIARNPEDFGERDGIERAIRDLARAGVLHRPDPFVRPTRAALCAYELLEGWTTCRRPVPLVRNVEG
jgi:hypothetical protein